MPREPLDDRDAPKKPKFVYQRRAETKTIYLDPEADEELSGLERYLQIDETGLEESLRDQPELFYKVSKQLALLSSRRDAAKQYVQMVEADVEMEIRREAQDNDEKVTVNEVEARKKVHKDVESANRQLLTYNLLVGQYSALKEAFQQRSYALKDLTNLYIANYYSDVNTSTESVKDVRGTDARRAMAERRRQDGQY